MLTPDSDSLQPWPLLLAVAHIGANLAFGVAFRGPRPRAFRTIMGLLLLSGGLLLVTGLLLTPPDECPPDHYYEECGAALQSFGMVGLLILPMTLLLALGLMRLGLALLRLPRRGLTRTAFATGAGCLLLTLVLSAGLSSLLHPWAVAVMPLIVYGIGWGVIWNSTYRAEGPPVQSEPQPTFLPQAGHPEIDRPDQGIRPPGP